MADRRIDNVVATREFELGEEQKVLLTVGAPFVVDENMQEFWCYYQIQGIGSEKIKRVIGGDSMQALCLALYLAGNDLYSSQQYKNGRLTWEGGMVFGDLALPVSEKMLADLKDVRSGVESMGRMNKGVDS